MNKPFCRAGMQPMAANIVVQSEKPFLSYSHTPILFAKDSR